MKYDRILEPTKGLDLNETKLLINFINRLVDVHNAQVDEIKTLKERISNMGWQLDAARDYEHEAIDRVGDEEYCYQYL